MIRLFLKFSAGGWIGAAISILTIPIVTALLRPKEMGRASMFTLAVGLASQLALVGADQAYARHYYSPGEDRAALLRNSMALPLALASLIAIGILLFGGALSEQLFGEQSGRAASLLAAGVVAAVVERFATLTIRMEQRALSYSVLRIVSSLVNFAAILTYAMFVSADYLAIATAHVAGLVVVGMSAIVLSRSVWRRGRLNGPAVRQMLNYGLPFVPTFAVMWLFDGMDKLMLRHYSSFTELGLYSAAFRFIALLSILETGFTTFWVPVSYEMFDGPREHASERFSVALSVTAAVLYCGGLVVLLVKQAIILLFAVEYRGAMSVMPFLLLIPIMACLSGITVGGIAYAKRTHWHLWIAAGAALTNYAINLVLVPMLGAKGAAISTGTAYILFFAARTEVSQRLFPLELGRTRLYGGVLLFATSCAVHSFFPYGMFAYSISVVTLLLFVWIYRSEYLMLARRVRESLATWRRSSEIP